MRFPAVPVLAVILLLFAIGLLADEAKLSVFVSVLPQKYFVEQVGGERVEVSVMVGPGQNPATFEPRPRQMVKLSQAQLYYRVGVPFEDVWMGRVMAANPALSLLDARDGLRLREMEPAGGHHHDYDRHPGDEEKDPHVWLSPSQVRVMITHLRDHLIELDPRHEKIYRANHARFDKELVQLEADIRRRLSHLQPRKFMVFHPSWGYFADAFNLQQIPIESEGKEPGARTLARLMEQARVEGVKTIFVQQQFSQAQARALADALDAQVTYLDPLAENYPDNLRRVADIIAEGVE